MSKPRSGQSSGSRSGGRGSGESGARERGPRDGGARDGGSRERDSRARGGAEGGRGEGRDGERAPPWRRSDDARREGRPEARGEGRSDGRREFGRDHRPGGAASRGQERNHDGERGAERPRGRGRAFGDETAPSTQRAPAPRQVAHRRDPMAGPDGAPGSDMRIAKAMARAGLCSRREAERWIEDGRVSVNGEVLRTPARDVGPKDKVLVDGRPLPGVEPTQLWRYYKPRGLVTTHADPQGRPTVFDALPPEMLRVVSVGRLDFNTEGLLLLTNDGALARHLELPATGWLRRYRVRAHGRVTQADLDKLKNGITVEGVRYGPIEATLDSTQGANMWLTVAIREGKNREVRKILSTLALDVNRLIRVSYGPFQLLDLQPGQVETVRRRMLADQLGSAIAAEFRLVETADDRKARWKDGPKRGGDGGGAA